MSDLIVDFPNRRCIVKRTVQFSNITETRICRPINQEASAMYYSSKDYKAMRVATKKAALRANKVLGALSSSTDSESIDVFEDDVVLTGIENILTPDIIKRTKAWRAQHVKAVLLEQERQASAGVYDADRFACVSHHFSKSAARRAHNIGLMQSR